MSGLLAFLQAAGAVLAATVTVVNDAIAVSNLIKKVVDQGEPTPDDWAQLQTYQDANDAIINAPMAGEALPPSSGA